MFAPRTLSFPIQKYFSDVLHLNVSLGLRVSFDQNNLQNQIQNAPKTAFILNLSNSS